MVVLKLSFASAAIARRNDTYTAVSGLRFSVWGLLGGVPREQKMLKGHLHRVIHHQVY